MPAEERTSPQADGSSLSSTARAVEAFCQQVLDLAGLEATASAAIEDGNVRVNISGPDRPYVLSNTASVLNCLEYLANKVFRPGKKEDDLQPIVLDSDRYRQHREAELVLLAQMASKKVLGQRKPLSLQPMTPRERRIVHLALAAIEGVRSESAGDGDHRSVTIYPN